MSSYYAAYHGSALVLEEKEFEQFLENYKKLVVKKLKKELVEDFNRMLTGEGCQIREYSFVKSNKIHKNPNGILMSESKSDIFEILDISPDDCDGMLLCPYLSYGKLHWEADNFIDYRYEKIFVIFSDYQLDSPLTFLEKPYNSYSDFVNEFKEKLSIYLPENFDWDKHIGSFSYCCYA